jgi:hypothetical protein
MFSPTQTKFLAGCSALGFGFRIASLVRDGHANPVVLLCSFAVAVYFVVRVLKLRNVSR